MPKNSDHKTNPPPPPKSLHRTLTSGELRLEGIVSDGDIPQHFYPSLHYFPPDARQDGAHGAPLDGPQLAILRSSQPLGFSRMDKCENLKLCERRSFQPSKSGNGDC